MDVAVVFKLLGMRSFSRDDKAVVPDIDVNVFLFEPREFEGRGHEVLLRVLMYIHPAK